MTGVDTVNLTSSPVTVPFGVRDVVKYSRGQASAREYALSKGFALDTFVELAVQWGEQDPNAHLNNAVYFKFLEAGRIAFIRAFALTLSEDAAKNIVGSGTGSGIILGEVSNKYLRPVFAPDHILVAHKLVSLGDKKINVESMIYSYSQQAQVSSGTATLVTYDYDNQCSTLIPADIRKSLETRLPRSVKSKL